VVVFLVVVAGVVVFVVVVFLVVVVVVAATHPSAPVDRISRPTSGKVSASEFVLCSIDERTGDTPRFHLSSVRDKIRGTSSSTLADNNREVVVVVVVVAAGAADAAR